MYGKIKYDYQYLSPFKKWIPTSTSMPKNAVFENENTSFNQRKEMYVKEDYQFLSNSKNISRHVQPCQKIQMFKLDNFFSIKGTKCMWKKTINFCIPTRNSLPKTFSVWNWIHFFQSKNGNECERNVWLSIFVTL